MHRVALAAALVLLAAACGGEEPGAAAGSPSPSPVPPAPVEPSGTNDPPVAAEGAVAYALLFGEGPVAVDVANGQIIEDFRVPAGGSASGGVEVDTDDGAMLFHRAMTGTQPQVVELTPDDGTENVRLSNAAWAVAEPGGHRWAHVEDELTDDNTRLADLVLRDRIGDELTRWNAGSVTGDLAFEEHPLRHPTWAGDRSTIAIQANREDDLTVVLLVPVDSGDGPLGEVATELSAPDDGTELAAPAYRGDELTVAIRDSGEASGSSQVVAVNGTDVGETIIDDVEGRILEMDWDADGEQLLLIVEDVAGDTHLLVWDGSELREVLTGVTSAAW